MIPILITEAARNRLIDLSRGRDGALGMSLFIAKGKGCGGNEYRMDYVMDRPQGHDVVPIDEGVDLYIPMTDSFMMFGMTVDYETDGMGNARFVFTNPNETGRCGCGESFSL